MRWTSAAQQTSARSNRYLELSSTSATFARFAAYVSASTLTTPASLSRISSRTSADPMNPAPPVTRMTSLLMSVRIAVKGKEVGKLRKSRELAVPFRQNGPLRAHRPCDPDPGVVPGKPALGRRIIVGGHLVHDLGVRFEGTVAVREARRHIELLPIFSAQSDGDVTPEGR